MRKLNIGVGKDLVKVIAKTNGVINKIPVPIPDVLSFFEKLCEAYQEKEVTAREIARIESNERILSKEITKRYDFYYYLFDNVFAERRAGISKSFEIINTGINQNNNDLVINGLRALGQIVSSSPFADIDKLRNLLESNQLLEI